MDAREKWHKESMRLVGEFAKTVGNACFGLFVDESKPALDRLEAHLRTTPEGFALVPVERLEQLEKFVPTVSEYIDNSPINRTDARGRA